MDAEAPTAELDAEDACEEELCPEAPAVRTKKAPELLIQAEVAAHDTVPCPYRSWCEVCVAPSGKEDVHARSTSLDVETGLPVVSLDYEFLEGPVTVPVGTTKPSGAALGYTCTAKGPSDAWAVKQLVRDVEDWGLKDIALKQMESQPCLHSSRQSRRLGNPARSLEILQLTTRRATAPLRRQSRTLQGSYVA